MHLIAILWELFLFLAMAKTYGRKSLLTSALITLGLLVISYLVIRHRIGFMTVAALILLFDVRIYAPRYQMVTITDNSLSFSSVNPLQKKITIALTDISKVNMEILNELFYTVAVSATGGNNTVRINMYPSEFKALARNFEAIGLQTETRSKEA